MAYSFGLNRRDKLDELCSSFCQMFEEAKCPPEETIVRRITCTTCNQGMILPNIDNITSFLKGHPDHYVRVEYVKRVK